MRIVLASLALAGCATAPAPPLARTASVPATVETTAVATANADAADDPAIWRNPRRPGESLIVATDKKLGLNVYGLDGRLRSTLAAGRVNNVDLRQLGTRIVVAASDRTEDGAGKLALFELDPKTSTLTVVARVPADVVEAYGLCLYQPRRNTLYAFVVGKDGSIVQMRIDGTGATIVRRMKLATQSEGCVADDRTRTLYVTEEGVGIWRFGAEPGDPVEPVSIAKVGPDLVADVEGIAIAAKGRRGGYLVVSSQGDNAYALWSLPTLTYAGRFRIAGGAIDGTSETDGIEVSTARFPGFPGGIMIAQDGDNAPEAQNFKLLPWGAVVKALGLR